MLGKAVNELQRDVVIADNEVTGTLKYGSHVFAPAGDGKMVPNRYTVGKTQLALFTVVPKFISNRATFWLRDVVSSAHFAVVDDNGRASSAGASDSRGVRPVFPIG